MSLVMRFPQLRESAGASFIDGFQAKRIKRKAKKRPPPSLKISSIKKYAPQVSEMKRSGDWAKAKPSHFVVLFLDMHEGLYKVPVAGITPKDLKLAVFQFARIIKKEFDSKPQAFAEFMYWVVKEETRRLQWCEQQSISPMPLTWYSLCGIKLLTRYRMATRTGRDS